MKKIFCLLFAALLFGQVKSQQYTFNVNGEERYYYFHLPASLQENAPLVFVLHGYSGSAEGIRDYSNMDELADDNGFAVCYPQGMFDDWNCRFWNVGYSFHDNETVDDVEFITALAQYLQSEYNLSSQFTFCTGMSNGGDMSYLLAAEASDVFSAVAPVAGCMMKWIYDSCSPNPPIPVFEIHGTNDDVTWWEGDINDTQDYGPYMGVMPAIDLWAQLNGCSQTVTDTLPDIAPSDGSIVERIRHINGINNNEVWLYKVINGGHDWPGSWGNMDVNSSEEIWSFFSKVISNITSLEEIGDSQITQIFELNQNYPNPFNGITTIRFYLPQTAFVELTIYNTLGMEIAKPVNDFKPAGIHSCRWNGTDSRGNSVASGVYLYRMKVGENIFVRKLVFLK